MKPINDMLAAVQEQMSAGHFKQAAQMCDSWLDASPMDVTLLALLTTAREHAGEIHGARRAALRWVDAAPLDAHAHYRLATIEQRLCNYMDALERYDLAAALGGSDEHVVAAAIDAMNLLDSLQLRQVLALTDVDTEFAIKLRMDPRRALEERGFALTEETFHRFVMVQDSAEPRRGPRAPRPC